MSYLGEPRTTTNDRNNVKNNDRKNQTKTTTTLTSSSFRLPISQRCNPPSSYNL
ncbi:hypothetical protein [endosymbiont GvMRE of Glomus versiforme]|uniref:hypothetical protein n=1 Tax=endosymbiont GvMRE of Glomus versiforme TaxID=2039283 RepID=UPI00155912A7|nr:hypothetical protein [endosymbiont GvMRE of Glomus versiforme]